MVIQDSILRLYSPVIKRLRYWLVPLILLLLLGTAYGKFHPQVLYYFTAIELTAAHFYLGWLLGIIWLIFVYDFFFTLFTGKNQAERANAGAAEKAGGLMVVVNTFFYILFFLICLSGLMKYAAHFMLWQPLLRYHLAISLVHVTLGWLFMATALVKYYLTLNHWMLGLLLYLRED